MNNSYINLDSLFIVTSPYAMPRVTVVLYSSPPVMPNSNSREIRKKPTFSSR